MAEGEEGRRREVKGKREIDQDQNVSMRGPEFSLARRISAQI